MKRPLRVVGLGWELIEPAVVANDGDRSGKQSAFAPSNLTAHLRAFKTAAEVEAALARGGHDEGGADVAILPLPEFVAAHERIKALSPTVFFITGC